MPSKRSYYDYWEPEKSKNVCGKCKGSNIDSFCVGRYYTTYKCGDCKATWSSDK